MPDMPEWVHVWAWLRFSQRNHDPLPQQQIPNAISDEEYERHHQGWLAAGSPTITQAQLVGAVAGEDPLQKEIPF